MRLLLPGLHDVEVLQMRLLLWRARGSSSCRATSTSSSSADQVEYLLEVQVHPLLVENNSGAYDSLDSGGNITIKCGVNGLKILSDYPPFILQPDWQILLNMFRCRNWNKGKHHMLRPD
ncbi:uncharacterized protein [Triticum aestivum]|uniref:uncharacterized protein isoform X2 n=1 Tax=Triticum aestivum TaxID=4565 RepID=UPI001D0346A8|nr:uncharacterized protein LOC123165390 isoform X2 [Triticum aestivum]